MRGSMRYIKSLLCDIMEQKYYTIRYTSPVSYRKNGRLSAQSNILLAGTSSIPWSSLDTGAYPLSPENWMILSECFFCHSVDCASISASDMFILGGNFETLWVGRAQVSAEGIINDSLWLRGIFIWPPTTAMKGLPRAEHWVGWRYNTIRINADTHFFPKSSVYKQKLWFHVVLSAILSCRVVFRYFISIPLMKEKRCLCSCSWVC